jgi:hypothetical protein
MDPIQANLLPGAILWEAEGDVVIDDGTKVGCTRLTTLKQIPIPTITPEQRVTFALKCALHVYKEPSWVAWAQAWVANTNRDADAANAAADAAAAAAATNAAAATAAVAASYYAAVAAYAVRAAVAAVAASCYADAAVASYYTARAAAYYAIDAAATAARAAADAAAADADFTFIVLIAKEVCDG